MFGDPSRFESDWRAAARCGAPVVGLVRVRYLTRGFGVVGAVGARAPLFQNGVG